MPILSTEIWTSVPPFVAHALGAMLEMYGLKVENVFASKLKLTAATNVDKDECVVSDCKEEGREEREGGGG